MQHGFAEIDSTTKDLESEVVCGFLLIIKLLSFFLYLYYALVMFWNCSSLEIL